MCLLTVFSITDDMMQPANTGSGEIWALPNQQSCKLMMSWLKIGAVFSQQQILQSTWDNMIKEFLIKQQVWLMDAFIDFAFAAHSTTRNLNRKYIIVLSIKNR